MANTAQFHHFLLDPKLSEESNIAFDKCAHTQNQTIALVWFQEFILFILNGSRISVGHLQDTMVFAENQLFKVLPTLAELLSSGKQNYFSHTKILCSHFFSGTPSQRIHRHRLFT